MSSPIAPALPASNKHQPEIARLGDEKQQTDLVEDVEGDVKGEESAVRITLTAEDDVRIRRKTDKYVLSILVWVYFLQIYDKTVFGYGNTYGLSTNLGLVKSDYSLASSMTSIATLAWQPFSAYILVRFPPRYIMTVCVFCWGTSAACMAAVTNGGELLATRFLLGLFEAANIPMFSMLTSAWYRRSEQPTRVMSWFIMNSAATIVAALVSYGFGHIDHPTWHPWQSIYLSAGLITVLTTPLVWFRLNDTVSTAKFWADDYERDQAIERLRANQTGGASREFKWKQVLEMFLDPKSWLFAALICIPNLTAHVANTFGPTLINGFGFDKFNSSLLNIPFGGVQAIAIAGGSYAAQRFKLKSATILVLTLLGLAGSLMLYFANVPKNVNVPLALVGYYMMGISFGLSPVIYSFAIANVGGNTKKSTMLSFMNCATATGQLTGPLLLNAVDAPRYLPGIRSLMIAQAVLVAAVIALVVVLYFANKRQERRRVTMGLPAKVHDASMDRKYQAGTATAYGGALGGDDEDRTDLQNHMFVYVY